MSNARLLPINTVPKTVTRCICPKCSGNIPAFASGDARSAARITVAGSLPNVGPGLLVRGSWSLFHRWGKHHRNSGIHLDRRAFDQRLLISPLQHYLDGRVFEISWAGNISGAIHSTILTHNHVENYHAI